MTDKKESEKLKDYDPGVISRYVAISKIPDMEKGLSKELGFNKASLTNIKPALDGIFDAYKTNQMEEFIYFLNDMIPVALKESNLKISGGELTPEEAAEISKKTRQIEEKYPEISKRFTIEPLTAGQFEAGWQEVVEVAANIKTFPDESEAFSIHTKYDSLTHTMDIRFDKPVNPDKMLLKEKTDYVIEETGLDKQAIMNVIKNMDAENPTELTKTLNSAIKNANDKFTDGVKLSPALLLIEIKIQAEQEQTSPLSNINNNITHEALTISSP